MKIVVPLAGPDFEQSDGLVKSEILVDGRPLLRRVLETRRWWLNSAVSPTDYVFVLRDTAVSRRFAHSSLRIWYPGCHMVFLQSTAAGAALSTLAGVALIAQASEPLCVDLADIIYETQDDPAAVLGKRNASGVGLVFNSTLPIYSYFQTDEAGRVIRVAEKQVISSNASAGTYFFASAESYLVGLSHNLRDSGRVTFKSLFFVCPIMQGLLDAGREVGLVRVEQVRDIKTG
jgi:hypothetical protein